MKPLLLCLSHLRWDFVFQRPQQLLSRAAAAGYDVVFWEEPVALAPGQATTPELQTRGTPQGVQVVVPHLPPALDEVAADALQRRLLDTFLAEQRRPLDTLWLYTPLAAAIAGHVRANVTVYDCMDELSAFHGASPRLAVLEQLLLRRADLVFTGGRSLYEAKRDRHQRVHCFPSSVDADHFAAARDPTRQAAEPDDQARIARPRLGYFGVIDERIDLRLIDAVAAARPAWQVVMLGPVVKIDRAALPRRPNLHWLGMKPYGELPRYLAHWDVGLMPFADNAATRFISPTKTPEFLAAGVPLVSTHVADVVRDWGDGLVAIATGPAAIIQAVEGLLDGPDRLWLDRVDRRLGTTSWDATWAHMDRLVGERRRASGFPASGAGLAAFVDGGVAP